MLLAVDYNRGHDLSMHTHNLYTHSFPPTQTQGSAYFSSSAASTDMKFLTYLHTGIEHSPDLSQLLKWKWLCFILSTHHSAPTHFEL